MSEVYEIRPSTSSFFIQKLSEFLDPGEAEAIALAKELGADLLLIDERIGRRFAEAEQIACKGVVGILIEAKKEGFIQLLKPLLDDLVENLKFRLSHHIYKLALQRQTNSISK